jgi:signal transduction histidine kinase
MGGRIAFKLVGIFTLVILTSVLIMNFFVSIRLRGFFEEKLSLKLRSNALIASSMLSEDISAHDLPALETRGDELAGMLGSRVTVIDETGEVLSDSEGAKETMGNHLDRPEVQRALSSGLGESNRYSDTLGESMKYVAVAVGPEEAPSGIIRLSVPLREVQAQNQAIYRTVLAGGLVAVVFGLAAGFIFSRGIITPITEMTEAAISIAKGNFSKRIRIKSDDELGVLAQTLNIMTAELEQKIARLESLDRVRTDFVANVSHELKTPLTSIKGFVETLEDGALEDGKNARRFLSIIKRHAYALINITDDLLKLSELEAGEPRLDMARIDMRELVDEASAVFEHTAREKGQSIKRTYEGGALVVTADKAKMLQVISNLLDNALKYSTEGVRALLQGRQGPFQGDGRHGPRALNSKTHHAPARRHCRTGKRGGQGHDRDHYLPVNIAPRQSSQNPHTGFIPSSHAREYTGAE